MKDSQRKTLETIKETLYSVYCEMHDDLHSEATEHNKLYRITLGKELDLLSNTIASVAQTLDLSDSRVHRNWDLNAK